jgi:eukaryotic-like serine/threonine-protein kinase
MAKQSLGVKAVFDRALEMEAAAQRNAYLDEACAEAPELRQQVDALLKAHEDAGSFLEKPAPDLGPTVDSQPGQPGAEDNRGPPADKSLEARFPSEEPGRIIGPYKLLQQIGEGGMGVVWMAEQTQPLQRKVALKIIKAGMDSRQVLARFEAERQALALMDHPNIARVLEAGATPEGRPYFAMELVKGQPITRYCDEHRLTPRERLQLFVPVCQAIQHAHQKGVIHRDIKPSNVLVAPYDGKPVVKVIDFGIAKAAGQPLTDKTLFTELGAVVGTLEYMSPEQAELNNQDIDTRSDIYSLGVLLYELLTGTPPLTRERLKQAAFMEMLRLIREEEPPKPSTRLSDSKDSLPAISAQRQMEPAKLTRLVRGELDWLIMKALEKDRNRRYETANGFAADVQRYLNDEPVQACPPSTGYRLRKFLRRNKGPVLAAGIVLLVLLGGIVGTTLGLVRADWALQTAVTAKQNETKALGDKLTEEEGKNEMNRRRIVALNGETKALKGWRLTAYYNWLQLAHNEYRANHVARADEMLHSDTKCPDDLRGFEWHFLNRLCHSELNRFPTTPSQGGLVSRWCRFSPDARSVVLFDAETRILHVYDTATGKETSRVPIGFQNFHDVVFSHDGQRLAVCPSGGLQDAIHVWDVATRGKRLILTGLKKRYVGSHGFSGAAFSPDGRFLAGADSRGHLFVWDLHVAEERSQTARLRFLGQTFGALAVAPAGAPLGGSASLFAAAADAHADALALRFQIGAHPNEKAPLNRSWQMKPAFSPDGKLVVTASQGDQMVRIWNAETGKLVRDLGSGPDCGLVAFSPKGTYVAATAGEEYPGSNELSTWVWEVKSGQTHCVIRGQTKPVNCLAFSPEEQLLATGSQDGTLTAWDLGTGQEVVTYRGHDRGVFAVAYVPDGTRLLAVGDDRVVRTWDARRHPERRLLRCNGAWQAAFSGDGRLVAAAGRTPTTPVFWGTMVWNAETGQELARFGNGEETAYAVAPSPDGKLVAAAVDVTGMTGAVRIWDVRTGQLVHNRTQAHIITQVIGTEAAVLGAAPGGGPLGPLLSRLGAREGLRWDGFTLVRSLPEQGLSGPYYAVAWSPDGRMIAAGGQDRILRVWDAATGKQLLERGGHNRSISAVAFSRDGKRLVSASGGITQQGVYPNGPIKLVQDKPEDVADVKVWDVATGQELRSWRLPGKGPGLALSPDGETVAVTFGDTGLKIVLSLQLGGGILGTTYTPAAHRPDVVRLYNVATGAEAAVLKGHVRPPWCVAFSPDGKRVVTGGGADETIKLWDANTGEEIMMVGRHPGVVTSVAFSQDGMKIVSTSVNSPAARVWDATPMPK